MGILDDIYVYIVVPFVRKPPDFTRMGSYSVYWAIESYLLGRNCPSERLQLIDGTVVYRVLKQYISKFNTDSQGPKIDLMTMGIWRFTAVDPSRYIKPVTSRQEWVPSE